MASATLRRSPAAPIALQRVVGERLAPPVPSGEENRWQMERELLEGLLDQGASLAQIGRRVGLHEATVAYWVQKHGLSASNRVKHVAKGPLERGPLEALVGDGRSVAEIAAVVDRSKTTVRYWLREYGLRTRRADRGASVSHPDAGTAERLARECPKHGRSAFQRTSSGGYRCLRCRSAAVTRRRRKVKRILVEEAGGACLICGYDRCVAALEFHHLDPTEKRFALSLRGARSLESLRAEARKCVLLCANCHCEVELGIATVPPRWRASVE
jgi:transposase-like protein